MSSGLPAIVVSTTSRQSRAVSVSLNEGRAPCKVSRSGILEWANLDPLPIHLVAGDVVPAAEPTDTHGEFFTPTTLENCFGHLKILSLLTSGPAQAQPHSP